MNPTIEDPGALVDGCDPYECTDRAGGDHAPTCLGIRPTAWYMAPMSACPECWHGPRWHNDETVGCMRMNGPWCECRRFYAVTAAGPDEYTDASEGEDG